MVKDVTQTDSAAVDNEKHVDSYVNAVENGMQTNSWN